MEPQLEGCGKCVSITCPSRQILLQWSRNLRVAESGHAAQEGGQGDQASMEPQLEGCGKHGACAAYVVYISASMEPQLEGCGKQAGPHERQRPAARFNGAAT